jgi:hypothetical protein
MVASLIAFPACDSNDDDDGGGSANFRGCSTQSISVGQSRTGTVTADDCEDASDDNVDYYRLRLSSSRSVRISADATDDSFDTFLTLYASSGSVIETDDDDGSESTNSLIQRELDSGDYVIGVSGFFGDLGAYRLRVE